MPCIRCVSHGLWSPGLYTRHRNFPPENPRAPPVVVAPRVPLRPFAAFFLGQRLLWKRHVGPAQATNPRRSLNRRRLLPTRVAAPTPPPLGTSRSGVYFSVRKPPPPPFILISFPLRSIRRAPSPHTPLRPRPGGRCSPPWASSRPLTAPAPEPSPSQWPPGASRRRSTTSSSPSRTSPAAAPTAPTTGSTSITRPRPPPPRPPSPR